MVSVCIPVGRFVCHSNRLLLQTMRGRDLLHYSHKICANIEDCKSKAKWHPRGNHPATDTAGAIPKNHLPENTVFGKVVRVGVGLCGCNACSYGTASICKDILWRICSWCWRRCNSVCNPCATVNPKHKYVTRKRLSAHVSREHISKRPVGERWQQRDNFCKAPLWALRLLVCTVKQG